MSVVSLPTKTDSDCSIIHLIDENFCIKNSLDIINFNCSSLSGKLVELENNCAIWNQIYSNFLANSSMWLIGSTNLQQYNKEWSSAYSTVATLSANWLQEFSIYYPQTLLLDSWYGISGQTKISTSYSTEVLPNWLKTNFPNQNYANNQIINLFINLHHYQPFSFTFSRIYKETCQPQGGAKTTCGYCPQPHRGCNHHGGRAGWGPCTNAYDHCERKIVGPVVRFSCSGTGGKDLTAQYNLNSYDTSIARIIRLKYINYSNNWVLS